MTVTSFRDEECECETRALHDPPAYCRGSASSNSQEGRGDGFRDAALRATPRPFPVSPAASPGDVGSGVSQARFFLKNSMVLCHASCAAALS